ncbi:MAG TPA: TlpA disulfide reductase family protein [Steroidobacteraceae bacterium]|nr:TlpA disulfide reductase family protein [Steroidobacteraceae bacterium]
MRQATALLALLVLLASCAGPDAPPLGLYRAVASTDGGDLPFGLELVREDDGLVAYLVNGPERVRATDVRLEDGNLSIRMPGYQNRIEAAFKDGRFEGTLFVLRPRGIVRELRLVAMPGETWRFFPKPDAAPLDFAGRWALTFRDADGGERAAIAELVQDGHVVTGTVLRQSGDDRYIAGEARGDTLFLSRFDGGTAYLYLARLGSDGVLAGEQSTGGGSQESFSGRRDPTAKLDNPAERTALKPGIDRLEFSFPDVDGKLHQYPDDRHAGKVVLVTVGGSWCPNCHDEAAFLKELLSSRASRGLEVIQLMFERTTDFESSAQAARDFAEKFAIDYPVLVAGTVTDDDVLKKLPQVARFRAYPTLFIIDRKGIVREIHSGFVGPAAGRYHEEQAREMTALVDSLLAEQG